MESAWDTHVSHALREVKNGQHLRFINSLYLTKEVCLAALMHETSHNSSPYDICSVPVEHLDYVVEQLEILRGQHIWMKSTMEYLKEYAEKKKKKYDNTRTRGLLEKYGVETYDDLLKEIYLEKFGTKLNLN